MPELQCSHCRISVWLLGEHCKCHPTLCCDCFDLSYGMSLEKLNEERRLKGRPPIEKEWPGE